MIEIITIIFVSVLLAIIIIIRILAGSSKDKSKKAHKGKRCPSCKTIIDFRRKTCQHCGYKFE